MISINTLPDDVLIAIFDQYVNGGTQHPIIRGKAWQSLVHVCRRWRSIIFESPRHLDLQLVCRERTRAKDTLDVWPVLPLIIECQRGYEIGRVDNIITVLERSDRVCRIELADVRSSDLEIFLAAMQQSFPELTDLLLRSVAKVVPVVPDSFFGGSAPRLKTLKLDDIPFPGLPKLLLSATQLVTLHLSHIPHSGYFSPDMMGTALSTLTSLESLSLQFQSPRSCPDQASRRPPPSTRSVLPVLGSFQFQGVTEYLEDLVACIDAPRLNNSEITFFNDTVFDTPHFIQFMSRTPVSRELERAYLTLRNREAGVGFSSISSRAPGVRIFSVNILCHGLDWQLSSLEQVCTSCLPPLSMLEDLYVHEDRNSEPDWKDDIENGLWLQLLQPFTTVKNLHLSKKISRHIGPALQELAEGITTEMLPALQNILLGGIESLGPAREGIGKFAAARQVASRPIQVYY